jgi:hypothetical protein
MGIPALSFDGCYSDVLYSSFGMFLVMLFSQTYEANSNIRRTKHEYNTYKIHQPIITQPSADDPFFAYFFLLYQHQNNCIGDHFILIA